MMKQTCGTLWNFFWYLPNFLKMRTKYFGIRDCVSDVDIILNNPYYKYAESSTGDVF